MPAEDGDRLREQVMTYAEKVEIDNTTQADWEVVCLPMFSMAKILFIAYIARQCLLTQVNSVSSTSCCKRSARAEVEWRRYRLQPRQVGNFDSCRCVRHHMICSRVLEINIMENQRSHNTTPVFFPGAPLLRFL